MKKITYLVAPLMVLPFLVGCNKGGDYKVYVSSVSQHLRFTSEDGKKDLNEVKAKKGEDFKFRVQAEEGTTPYKIVDKFILVAISDEILYEGVTVTPDNADYSKSAIVTVDKSKVTGDITVGGIAGIDGYYIYDIPLLAGIRVAEISGESEDYPGYVDCNSDLTITFNSVPQGVVSYSNSGWEDITPAQEKTVTIKADSARESIMIFARGLKAPWLDYFSWEQISSISNAGLAKDMFAEGDTKTITVNGQPHVVEIIGFNHDSIDEPTEEQTEAKAGITFRFKTLISDKDGKAITTKWGTSHQGYVSSTLQDFVANQVPDMLPADLQAVIQPVYKQVGLYKEDGGWYIKNYQTKLFPLSTAEYDQEDAYYSVEGEGKHYSGIVKAGVNENVLADAGGTKHNYWLRSPSKYQGTFVEYNNAFVMQSISSSIFVEDAGTVAGLDVSTARAVAPGFCI